MDLREDLADLLPVLPFVHLQSFFLDKQLYDAVKLFDLQIIKLSKFYLQKLQFVFAWSLS